MIGQDDFGRAIKECVIRWPTLEKQLDVYYSHLSFINYEAFSDICQRFVEDFRSMPLPKDFKEAYGDWKKENWERDPELSDRPGYKIQMGANCRKCGKKNIMCIEEPLGSEYECRPCYTGLTNRELISKFSELIEMLGGKFKYSEVKYVKDNDSDDVRPF